MVNRSNIIYSIMVQRGIVIPEYKEVTEADQSSLKEGIDSISPAPAEKSNPSYRF
ncbi:MAG: hypothetical protein QME90_17870 [Thermodesulfobacteriota bacterium]|nr:hypothetical protein [Thermodesulfobacteriota bacterium]